MSFAQKIDFNTMMEPVAIRLLGEPAQKHGQEWRYGNRGSLAVDIKKGTWFDHEANIGGGVLDLIRRQGHEQPAAWLRSEGLLGAPQKGDISDWISAGGTADELKAITDALPECSGRADNPSSHPEWGTPKELPSKLAKVDDF